MAREIVIDPVTRIEGHAKITIRLGDDGLVDDARFHVTQFRGFEKLCEGRPFTEMPAIMSRICGICPVSHLVASSKACDELMAVRIPATAADLRRILNLAQLVQSHALSFFHLSSPDLLLGLDADPGTRNFFGVAQLDKQLALDGIALRKFGQQIIEQLGGKRIHPGWVVPGGVNAPLDPAARDNILLEIPQALERAVRTLEWFERQTARFEEEIACFANFPSYFMGLTDPSGALEFYDGPLCVMDGEGRRVAEGLNIAEYPAFIGEAVEDDSYLKSTYYLPAGYPDGMYRVGPLARLNLVTRCGTPRADEAFERFRGPSGAPRLSSFDYHLARLIEVIHGIEMIEKLLRGPDILSPHVRAHGGPNAREGVGCSEAPRGTLFHHYRIDENGLMEWANLIIATGHNNLAMNRGVTQVAKRYVNGDKLEESMLNRVEAVIRTFDPCLSCSTHAAGRMPLQLRLVDSRGTLLDELRRDQ